MAKMFARSQPKYLQTQTVLVLCEDSQSGKRYLEDARVHFRANASIEIAHCGKTDPIGIVGEALKRAARFDRVFCMIDRDRHPGFDEAVRMARRDEKVELIVSYPCFEYWLLLHNDYTSRPYVEEGRLSPAEVLIRDLRQCDGFRNYEKGSADSSPFQRLLGAPLAKARALGPRSRNDADDRGDPNPSTSIDLLLGQFEILGQPQPV